MCGTCVAGGGGNKGAIDCIDRGEGDTAADSPSPQAPVDQTPIQARQLRKGLQFMSSTNALRCKGAHLHRKRARTCTVSYVLFFLHIMHAIARLNCDVMLCDAVAPQVEVIVVCARASTLFICCSRVIAALSSRCAAEWMRVIFCFHVVCTLCN